MRSVLKGTSLKVARANLSWIFSALKRCPREPVIAGPRFFWADIAASVGVRVGMRGAEALVAMRAARAVLCRVGRVALAGACVTDRANGAIRCMSYVLCTGNGFFAVEANGAVLLGSGVICFSCTAAYAASGVARIGVLMLCIGHGFFAVFTYEAIARKRLVAERGFPFHGFGAFRAANAAKLVKDLRVFAIGCGFGDPFAEFMLRFSRKSATVAVGITGVGVGVPEGVDAFLGFLRFADEAFPCKDLCLVAISRRLFGKSNALEAVFYGSHGSASVAIGIAGVVVGVSKRGFFHGLGLFLLAFGAGARFHGIGFTGRGGLDYKIAEAM